MAIVYRHIRLDTNKVFYIGIGNNTRRAYCKKNRNNYWHNVVNLSDYKVDILFDDLSREEACEKEMEFIQLYGRKDLNNGTLVNMTDGGEDIKNLVYTQERRQKMSINSTGSLNLFYGKKHSEETKKILSQKALGKKTSDAVKLKISKSLKGDKNYWYGKKLSDEHKLKLSAKAKNRKLTDKEKDKLRITNSKRIELYRYINNEFYVYESLRQAEMITGIERKYIKKYLKELGFITKQEAIDMGLL
jgi:hypothetical protein